MLNQVTHFEQANLKSQLREIANGSVETVLARVNDPVQGPEIQRQAFVSALTGIREGTMTYSGDQLLPMIENEMQTRLTRFQGLSADEESALLQLNSDQRQIVSDNDRKAKNEFLAAAP